MNLATRVKTTVQLHDRCASYDMDVDRTYRPGCLKFSEDDYVARNFRIAESVTNGRRIQSLEDKRGMLAGNCAGPVLRNPCVNLTVDWILMLPQLFARCSNFSKHGRYHKHWFRLELPLTNGQII
ncbi:hypothetical protein KM043_010114 [Ampulex compressa]|nr:hypothetical protein KM043_010114 [Ampulex compressa]